MRQSAGASACAAASSASSPAKSESARMRRRLKRIPLRVKVIERGFQVRDLGPALHAPPVALQREAVDAAVRNAEVARRLQRQALDETVEHVEHAAVREHGHALAFVFSCYFQDHVHAALGELAQALARAKGEVRIARLEAR